MRSKQLDWWENTNCENEDNIDYDDPMGFTGFQYRMMGQIGDKLLPGLLGDWTKVCGDMVGYTAAGDLKGLWSASLDSFKDTSAEDGSAAPTFFTKMIGQLPLFYTKINKEFLHKITLLYQFLHS